MITSLVPLSERDLANGTRLRNLRTTITMHRGARHKVVEAVDHIRNKGNRRQHQKTKTGNFTLIVMVYATPEIPPQTSKGDDMVTIARVCK